MLKSINKSKPTSNNSLVSKCEENEDELDYMSEAFVNNLNDVKPGLNLPRSVKRQRVSEAKCKDHCSTNKELQSLTDGLQKQVGPENKGFSLLAKMGYTPGMGLGKNAKGRAEPVGIEIPKGREGVGFASARQESIQLKENIQVAIRNEFRGTMAARFQYNKSRRQIHAAQRICRELDMSDGIMEPCDPLFWPPVELPEANDDLQSDCPQGSTSIKRKRAVDDDTEITDGCDQSLDNELAKFDCSQVDESFSSLTKLLAQLVGYLRGQYYYCFWCSARYESFGELLDLCPGETEDDHG